MMRLFLGLNLPEDIKETVYQYLLPIHQSEKGWEKLHDYHQTLLFIGETSSDELDKIKARMNEFEHKAISLTPTGFRFFNRRVMYLSIDKSPELLELKDQVNKTFAEWAKPQSRPFLPHVTVKRWQRYEFDHLQEGLKREFVLPPFEVSTLDLFKSEKDIHNNKYHVIYSRKLF